MDRVFVVARCGQVESQFANSRYEVLGHQVGVLVGGLGVDLGFGVLGHRLVSVYWGFEFVVATTHMEPGNSEHLKRSLATIRLKSHDFGPVAKIARTPFKLGSLMFNDCRLC
jgi:hypothetical protein